MKGVVVFPCQSTLSPKALAVWRQPFEPHQAREFMAFREAVEVSFAVFRDALRQVGGGADVQDAVVLVGYDVHGRKFFHAVSCRVLQAICQCPPAILSSLLCL